MTGRLRLAGAVAALLVLGFAVAGPPQLPSPWSSGRLSPYFVALAWLAFLAGAALVLRLPRRVAIVLILLGGLLLPLAAAGSGPHSSDDVYRYGWDGRVQAAGIDPYRYAPAAPELVGLRDPVLWPAKSSWCVQPGTVDPATETELVPGCTLINRPAVHTIYPPVAQTAFLLVHVLAPDGGPVRPYQLFAVLAAMATTLVLVFGLRRLGRDPRRAVLWAWCPTVALEAGNNAHIDVLAALLTGGALLVLAGAGRRTVWGGVLLGLAVATKLTPGLVLPAVLRRRRRWRLLGAVAGAVAVVYLPHLLAVGAGVLGYVPGYLREEGYADGARFALLSWFMPQAWAAVVAVVVLAAVALFVYRTAEEDRPWLGAATMVGTALLVSSPAYPWYALLLVVLVGLGGRVEWLAVAAAGYLAQHAHDLGLGAALAQRIGYGTAAAIVVGASIVLTTIGRRPVGRRPIPWKLRPDGCSPPAVPSGPA
jgi:hypothetical protein